MASPKPLLPMGTGAGRKNIGFAGDAGDSGRVGTLGSSAGGVSVRTGLWRIGFTAPPDRVGTMMPSSATPRPPICASPRNANHG